jgi:hypothetical protein
MARMTLLKGGVRNATLVEVLEKPSLAPHEGQDFVERQA